MEVIPLLKTDDTVIDIRSHADEYPNDVVWKDPAYCLIVTEGPSTLDRARKAPCTYKGHNIFKNILTLLGIYMLRLVKLIFAPYQR